ncbi:hypothetical protein [Hungatella sp.]|uniref:hypothetical protein n=1 Tax=Hungatella sp. TaxID=2613924 RepID=UPI003991C63E
MEEKAQGDLVDSKGHDTWMDAMMMDGTLHRVNVADDLTVGLKAPEGDRDLVDFSPYLRKNQRPKAMILTDSKAGACVAPHDPESCRFRSNQRRSVIGPVDDADDAA